MNSVQRPFTLAARILARRYCTKSTGTPSSKFAALKKNQARFQTDDGLPIFLKKGASDKILYQSTWVLLLIGAVLMIKLFYNLAEPDLGGSD